MTCELADVPAVRNERGAFYPCATHPEGMVRAVGSWSVMSAAPVVCDIARREDATVKSDDLTWWEVRIASHGDKLREASSTMATCAVLLGEARAQQEASAQKIADLERQLVTSSHRATDLDRIADLDAMLAKCRDYPREEDEQKIDGLEELVADLRASESALRVTIANERQQIVNLQAMCDAYRDQLQARSLTPHRIVTDEMVRRAAHATINYVTNESVRMMLEAALAVPDDASNAPQLCPGEDARDNGPGKERHEPPPTLAQDIERAINRHSAENGSDTPDFILARYLMGCLNAFDCATNEREEHYGRGHA